jgi:hypothetical protein
VGQGTSVLARQPAKIVPLPATQVVRASAQKLGETAELTVLPGLVRKVDIAHIAHPALDASEFRLGGLHIPNSHLELMVEALQARIVNQANRPSGQR